jgi:hypothetical protein
MRDESVDLKSLGLKGVSQEELLGQLGEMYG